MKSKFQRFFLRYSFIFKKKQIKGGGDVNKQKIDKNKKISLKIFFFDDVFSAHEAPRKKFRVKSLDAHLNLFSRPHST